jgi:hypothetical protein
MIRTTIYKSYKKFKDYKEKQGKLLKQQVFLSSYIKDNYSNIDRMLLFHGIGTGKTCTSITIAETIMKLDRKMKVLVILPARLKTNFIDELISETCGLNRYISKDDYNKFIDSSVSTKEKDKIRQKFNKKISENYEIISYERLRMFLLASTDYKTTIAKLTKNRIIIIDEVHNLIASKINIDDFDKILKSKVISKKTNSINAVLLRLITRLADKSSKLFLLTATPVFDNFGQFTQLVLNLSPDADPNNKKLDYLINQIKGKVSFYKLKDKSDFPSFSIKNHKVQLSEKQINAINSLDIKNDENEDDEYDNDGNDDNDNDIPRGKTFCMNERQISISLLNKNYKNKIFENLDEYAPKLKLLFSLLKLKGKHVIFSNFIQYCLHLIADYLKSKGWSDYTKTGSIKNKTFVLWDASLNDKEKQEVKAVLNSKANIQGEIIKVILGSPSIKEGISFKHIQHLHQIDPVWNSSAKEQIEGRCIRFKSHEDIPLDDKTLKRHVVIHNYIGTMGEKERKTCDERIYEDIMVKKKKIISEIEKLLSKVSIDYYLWTKTDKSPKSHSKSSIISATSADTNLRGIITIPAEKKKIGNDIKCPRPRRPFNGKCINIKYPYLSKNKHKEDCCFAKLKTPKSSCPSIRRPIEGKCINPKYQFLSKNKKGDLCCYTKEQKK